MFLYKIINELNGHVYIGITRGSIKQRWASHKSCARRGIKSKLYDAMRSYGLDAFSIEVIATFTSEDELLQAEKAAITQYRNLHGSTYNILDGGESYFPIHDKEAWRAKLKEKRQGRKPALGMKHTDENKAKFSASGKYRWDLYGRYPDEVTEYSFKDAHAKFGISKTHYYRLRKDKAGKV